MLMLALLLAFPAVSPRGAVAAAHPLAAEAGASMLRRGGNAVDAAVAAAFALSVVEPVSSGLGGGGFALVYTARDRQVHVLDFREVGPLAARPDMYVQDGQARQDFANAGPLSVAVPSAVKGYAELARRFGKKPLAQLVSPAEQIALRGFQVNVQFAHVAEHRLDCLAADAEAARIFLRKGEDGEYEPKQPGDKLIQPDLARTLHAIGERGPDAFYRGRVARSIVDSLASRGGIVSLDDLARVQVRERRPLESTYRGHRIVTMPLPSSGGFIVSALLNVLEREQPRAGGYRPERFLHAMIETEKRLYAVRQKLGDPAFNPGVEDRVRQMIGKDFAGDLWRQIGEQATPAAELVVHPEHGTTHVSAVDEEGNAVALIRALAVSHRGQIGHEILLVRGREAEIELAIEMLHHLIVAVVPAVVEIRAIEIGVQEGGRLDESAGADVVLQMIDKGSSRDMAGGATEGRLTAKRFEKKHLAAKLGVAGVRCCEQAPGTEPRVGQEIDVLDIRHQGIENCRRRLGSGEFVDNDVADKVAQRCEAAVMSIGGEIARPS